MAHAQKFLEVAELAATEEADSRGAATVAASLAVLAGIAAADAASCAALGRRSRSQDHRDALEVLSQVAGSEDAAKALRRLLDLKDTAHYGLISVSGRDLKTALRQADVLVSFAATIVKR